MFIINHHLSLYSKLIIVTIELDMCEYTDGSIKCTCTTCWGAECVERNTCTTQINGSTSYKKKLRCPYLIRVIVYCCVMWLYYKRIILINTNIHDSFKYSYQRTTERF